MDENQIKVGDAVTVRCWSNKMNGQQGTVVLVNDNPHDSMPIIVQFGNFREWPYSREELELHG